MKIAVEGCAHGELDKIYETLKAIELRYQIKIDLLIICGDFQAVRNPKDLECMAVLPKYRKLNTFYKYYSGEKKAPILTIFIGGNHEASNYLSELSYGGWVCPNIYYMGYANVINVGGLRIGGLSGIYKGQDYLRGHFECPPYDKSSIKSIYHVRNIDVFRLKQVTSHLDICISHDWPRGVYKHGNIEQLLRFKPFFRGEMESGKLGSQPAEELLSKLKPSYWFAAHLHCKFSAIVPHNDADRPYTKFLALDKCLPRRRFLQVLDIGKNVDSVDIEYDPEWLCILQKTNHLLNTSRSTSYMPGPCGFQPTKEDIVQVKNLFNLNLKIPKNFMVTAPKYKLGEISTETNVVVKYLNPQTQAFCKKLNLTDPYEAVYSSDSITISDVSTTDTEIGDRSCKPDKTSFSEEDEETECTSEKEIADSPDFFIDKVGSNVSSNVKNFLKDQHCDSELFVKKRKLETFPEIKSDSVTDSVDKPEVKTFPIFFKRRNADLYMS